MKKKHKFIVLDTLGVLFLVLGMIAMINSIYTKNPSQTLYMCNLGMTLIGIGILTKKSFIIMSQVYILAIPLLIWDVDFFYWLFLGKPLLGITDYFFLDTAFSIGKVVSLQHLFTVPLSIYAASLIGIKRKDAWKWSFVQITLVYIAVSLISPPELNINCIAKPCVDFYLGLPYGLTWFLIIFGMTFITSNLLNRLKIMKIES